jgi:plastocyanin
MIDIKHDRCIHEGCKKHPSFNKEGEKALYCNSHKQHGMIDVNSNKCIHEGCNTRPSFNKEGKKALYCALHKKEGMIDVKHNNCIHEGCNTRPSFNKEDEKALYCVIHKLPGMIDVNSNKCIHEGCNTRPSFNKEDKKALYCASHKKEGMIDVKSNRCIHECCTKQPTFNKEGEKALYCSKHKHTGMIDVINKRCKTHLCLTFVTKKYDGHCIYCYMHLFPDKPISRNYKTKEYSVVEYVKINFPHPWITDKTTGCSRRRPDLLLDLIDQVIIVEVDENKHVDYDCSCENKRIMELSQDLSHRPIVFIRFNPDDYTLGDTKITSCWGKNIQGICVVKPSKKVEWEQRLNILGETIYYWITHRTDKMIEIIQLFY